MSVAKVTSKRQITIPREIARKWNVEKGDGILFLERGNEVVVRPVKRMDLLSLKGSVAAEHPAMSFAAIRERVKSERAGRYVDPDRGG
jgi:AbrB family looped-hinge helix DNA binding protein